MITNDSQQRIQKSNTSNSRNAMILQNMVYSNIDILNEKFEELMDKLDEPTTRKFNRFLDKKDDNDVMTSIKKDLKLMMYNKRKIIEDTRKIIDNENEKMIGDQ